MQLVLYIWGGLDPPQKKNLPMPHGNLLLKPAINKDKKQTEEEEKSYFVFLKDVFES